MKFFLGTTLYSALLFKKTPGTITSLLVLSALYFVPQTGFEIKISIFILAVLTHFFCFSHFIEKFKIDDPSIYTLDETCAILLIYCFINIQEHFVAVFFLFRFFDILKPLGIKRIEKLPKVSAAIRNIGDDIIAAIYTITLIILYETIR